MSQSDQLIESLRRIAEELGTRSVPRHEFLRRSKVTERTVQRIFGSYNGLVEAAGLEPRNFPVSDAPTYSKDDMLQEINRVLRLPGAKLTRVFFDQHGNISTSACERRFGGWLGAVKAASALLHPDEDSSLLARVREYTDAPTPFVPSRSPTQDAETNEAEGEAPHRVLPPPGANLYGDFINFRGLQHAPVNEQGVVFLFGMICRELGYIVEIVKSGFPDCEAKRRIRTNPDMWQRVRIEFEFHSKNFRSHGHDPNECDVIVCWEDNWADCPIEVVALRPMLAQLRAASGSY